MTAEEYLNAHCKPEDWNNLEESLKDSILTNNVIEHMERYAALSIHNVIRQRELLSRFLKYYNQEKLTTSDEIDIDLFLNENKPT